MASDETEERSSYLISAYRAMRERKTPTEELVKSYSEIFGEPSRLQPVRKGNFERFFLVDPSIRTVIQSSATG